jgi:hypothetical protein
MLRTSCSPPVIFSLQKPKTLEATGRARYLTPGH